MISLISIILVFCDKDVKYLKGMLSQIKSKCHFNYEVILVDSRENDKSEIPSGYKIATKNRNVYCFEGRRMGLDLAKGSHAWFIDVDDDLVDDIYEDDFKMHLDKDIIRFKYRTTLKDGENVNMEEGENKFSWGNWQRFYSISVLKKQMEPIKRDIELVRYEDLMILSLMTFSRPYTEGFVDKVIYQYNFSNSTEFHTEKKNLTKEQIDLLNTGREQLKYICSFIKHGDILYKVISYKELKDNFE